MDISEVLQLMKQNDEQFGERMKTEFAQTYQQMREFVTQEALKAVVASCLSTVKGGGIGILESVCHQIKTAPFIQKAEEEMLKHYSFEAYTNALDVDALTGTVQEICAYKHAFQLTNYNPDPFGIEQAKQATSQCLQAFLASTVMQREQAYQNLINTASMLIPSILYCEWYETREDISDAVFMGQLVRSEVYSMHYQTLIDAVRELIQTGNINGFQSDISEKFFLLQDNLYYLHWARKNGFDERTFLSIFNQANEADIIQSGVNNPSAYSLYYLRWCKAQAGGVYSLITNHFVPCDVAMVTSSQNWAFAHT